jgi:hypothetical protein
MRLKGLVLKWTTPKGKELFALDSTIDKKELEEFQNLHKKFQDLDLCINASKEDKLCSFADLIRGQPQKKKAG